MSAPNFNKDDYLGVVLGTPHGLLLVASYQRYSEKGNHIFLLRCLLCGAEWPVSSSRILHHRYVGENGGRATNYCIGCRRRQLDAA